jgi:hypothetical protein
MAQPTGTVDFNLHDLVGIRLLDARSGDVRAGEAAFSADEFFVLRSKHKAQARVSLALDQAGQGPCAIVCESGLPAVPLLIPLINLTMVAKGVLPLHAAAFTYNGVGAVATGWSKGGKTEALLAFMAGGAQYVGDEWVYLPADDSRALGIPEPIRLWDWYVRQLPELRGRLSRGDRLRLAALRGVATLRRRMPALVPGRLARFLERQRYADLDPRMIFPEERCALAGRFDRLFWMVTHDARTIEVAPADAGEIARRMLHSLLYEWLPFLEWYRMYRFAFPDRRNELIESLEGRLTALLDETLAGRPAYTVAHPYPVDLAALFAAMRPLLEDGGLGGRA